MSGYDWDSGMSNNAVGAYEAGLAPLTRISLAHLKEAGWSETLNLARFLAKAPIGQGCESCGTSSPLWRSLEWHHSGGDYFNRVAFYNPADLIAEWGKLSSDDQAALRHQARAAQHMRYSGDPGRKVSGHYRTFSRRSRRPTGWQAFTGVKTGDWIVLDNGRKKRATGKNLTFSYIE